MPSTSRLSEIGTSTSLHRSCHIQRHRSSISFFRIASRSDSPSVCCAPPDVKLAPVASVELELEEEDEAAAEVEEASPLLLLLKVLMSAGPDSSSLSTIASRSLGVMCFGIVTVGGGGTAAAEVEDVDADVDALDAAASWLEGVGVAAAVDVEPAAGKTAVVAVGSSAVDCDMVAVVVVSELGEKVWR